MHFVHNLSMIDRIRSFLAVLEDGSVNKAALRLGMTQPTVSRHIQSLEQELGGSLFERDSRGMRPTDLGFFVRDKLLPVLSEFDAAIVDINAFAQGRHYQIKIGYIGLAATKYLNPALAKLKKEYPDLKLVLHDLTPMEQLDALRKGNLDIAMIGQDMIDLAEDFYQRKAASLGVCVVLPLSHPLSDRMSFSLSELSSELFVGVAEDAVPGRNAWIRQICEQAGFTPRFIAKTNHVSETYTLVVSEGAVALLPDYLEGAPPPGAVHRRLEDPWATWDLYVLRQRGRGSDAVKRLFSLIGKC